MRYPGGKGKTYQQVINLMPPHRVYIETHLGGGAVLRNKQRAERNIAIDVDPRIVDAWRAREEAGLELICARAEDFLQQHDFRGDELLYVDPPYHPQTRRQSRVYAFDYSVDDHQRLLDLLARIPCMIIVSGYAHRDYDAALRGWNTRTFDAKTHVDVREETLWFNFEPPQVLHDSRYLGGTFRERQCVKRRMERLQHRVGRLDPVERAAFAQWFNETYPGGSGRQVP